MNTDLVLRLFYWDRHVGWPMPIPGLMPKQPGNPLSGFRVNGVDHFKNGRHFSAYVGMVPRQHSSGGKNVLLEISKRGDAYLRTLLIHGGRAVVRSVQNLASGGQEFRGRNAWIADLVL